MTNRAHVLRVCAWNLLFYAALFVAFLSWPALRASLESAPEQGARRTPPPAIEAVERRLEGDALLAALRAGGHVLYVRHFETARRGIADDVYKPAHRHLPADVFDDCAWQRPLSDAGLAAAHEVGRILTALRIPIGAVYSSPYCRTVETAAALFGRAPERDPGLLFRTGSYPVADANRHLLEHYLAHAPDPGTNLAIVAHSPPMDGVGGIEEGETIVLRPTADGLELVARIPMENWLLADRGIATLGSANAKKSRARTVPGAGYAPPRTDYPPLDALLEAHAAGRTPDGSGPARQSFSPSAP